MNVPRRAPAALNSRRAAQLVFFAAGALYFELAIIRFSAAEVLYLGYFSNFMLITAFVGLGVGFLSHRRGIDLDAAVPLMLLFMFALVLVSEIDVSVLRDRFGLFFFGNVAGRAGLPGAVLMVVLFLSAAAFFAAVGARVARAFSEFAPLTAYTLDLCGSLAGIALFTIQSAVSAEPVAWVITGVLLLSCGTLAEGKAALGRACRDVTAGVCVVLLLLSSADGLPTRWSAYQKLTLWEDSSGLKVVFANGIAHQFMQRAELVQDSFYGVPYRLASEAGSGLDRVAIIGAGTGTDVAVALRAGAGHVDAVEIDRGIIDWGQRWHPDAPFADTRVALHVADGRKFLHDSEQRYDLVVFALPDSLTRISALASIRLESYLFTEEAFQSVSERLAGNGIFIMYNQYRWDWLVNKLATTVEKVFGRAPLIIREGETTLIAVGGTLQESTYERSGFERLATDDWPFLYMQQPGVHWLYVGMIAMFLVFSAIAVALLAPAGTLRSPDWPFFFMGAAFLLLETKSLAFFSLLFGTTWLVNSLAFAGILISVLLANLIVQLWRVRARSTLFAGLFISLLVAYLVPPGTLLGIDSAVPRFAGATTLVFAPIFFANLVFSREFRDVEESTRAFGWNLLGAVAGGGLEYLSLVMGFRNLLWLVALFYLAALFASRFRSGLRQSPA
jgi:spermidine synthase